MPKRQLHYIDVEDAQRYGVNAALFIMRLEYLINNNCISRKEYVFHDGRYWSYSPRHEIAKVMPYISDSSLKRITKKLRDEGVIETRSDLNDSPYNNTLWYTFTPSEYQERISLNNTYEKPKPLKSIARSDCSMDLSRSPNHHIEIKNKIKKGGGNFEFTESNEKKEEIQRSEKLSPPEKDITLSAKEIIDHWNTTSMTKCNFNQSILFRLSKFISERELNGEYPEDLKMAANNRVKVGEHANTWMKDKVSLQAFYGLNGRKPQYEQFLPDLFEISDYIKSEKSEYIEQSTEERLQELRKYREKYCNYNK